MKLSHILFGVFLVFLISFQGAHTAPRWKGFKKLERVGQHVRDGLIKAGPAVAVATQVMALGK